MVSALVGPAALHQLGEGGRHCAKVGTAKLWADAVENCACDLLGVLVLVRLCPGPQLPHHDREGVHVHLLALVAGGGVVRKQLGRHPRGCAHLLHRRLKRGAVHLRRREAEISDFDLLRRPATAHNSSRRHKSLEDNTRTVKKS